ncbi:MAG: glycoside hydrolase family 55 protein [Lachnospiraceae bacterium]|nr:glycoside hydrolase family 55 protein [Lachnospiraceae bacterium]
MDMETLHAANKYADKITAGMASGIKSHTVDEENNSITFHFNNGDSVAMKINTPMKDVEKAVNVYLANDENVENLGIVTSSKLLKNVASHINVLWFGLDNTGVKDNADLLQTILDSVENGTTLYFPAGEYLLSHGVTVNKSIQLLGDRKGRYLGRSDNTKIYGSCLKFRDTVSDATMITQGENCWSLTMHNLILFGNSGAWHDDGLNDETIPYAQYRYEVINENVNGVLCIHSADITDCSFCSFSGYGLSNAQAQNINQCKFFGNGIGVYVAKNDVMLRDCYITAGKTGIYCPGSKNVMIYDCYMDMFSEYGIYCEGYLSGFINAYIDHTTYSGIHADTINNLFMIANIHRAGMYYSGMTLDDLKVSDNADTELDNFSKSCAVSCKNMFKSTLQLGASPKPNDDASASIKSSPMLALYVQQCFTSILIGSSIEAYIRAFNTADALTVISNKGVLRYSYSSIKTTPSMVTKSYSPSSTTKAQNVCDMWYNTYKKELYIAKVVTDSATTWEKQYSVAEIAALEARIEALENANTTS